MRELKGGILFKTKNIDNNTQKRKKTFLFLHILGRGKSLF